MAFYLDTLTKAHAMFAKYLDARGRSHETPSLDDFVNKCSAKVEDDVVSFAHSNAVFNIHSDGSVYVWPNSGSGDIMYVSKNMKTKILDTGD